MSSCSFCKNSSHNARNCTSPQIDNVVAKYEDEIEKILEENIYTSYLYSFTSDAACKIGTFAATKVHRVIIRLHTKSLLDLKILFFRMFPNLVISSRSKYDLISNIAWKTCFEPGSPFETDDDAITVLNTQYQQYLMRAIAYYPKDINDARLKVMLSHHSINACLKHIRNKYLNEMIIMYNTYSNADRTIFVNGGIEAILESPFAIQVYFGNLTMEEIRHWRQFHYAELIMNTPTLSHEDRDLHIQHARYDMGISELPILEQSTQFTIQLKYKLSKEFKSDEDCAICYETKCNTFVDCNHEFCITCVKTYIGKCKNENKAPVCPLCRRKIKTITTNSILLS